MPSMERSGAAAAVGVAFTLMQRTTEPSPVFECEAAERIALRVGEAAVMIYTDSEADLQKHRNAQCPGMWG